LPKVILGCKIEDIFENTSTPWFVEEDVIKHLSI